MKKTSRKLQIAVAERLGHLDASAWDRVTREGSVFVQRPFLRALERACPQNVAPRYALLFDGDRPMAALVMQLVHIEGRSAVKSGASTGGLFVQLFDERALVLGNFAAWGETGLVLEPTATPAERELLWGEALRLCDRLRRFEKLEGQINVSFVKDATADEDDAALLRAGYQRAPGGPDMVLHADPAWRGFDDYLASLASKRRRAVKKTLEDVAAAGYQVVSLDAAALERHAARLDALYGQVWANADVRPLRLTGRFFVELKHQLGDACAVTGLLKDGELDGFGVCLKSRERGATSAVGYYLGFDKTKADAPLYLRLLISILERGLGFGARTISMGRTAEEPKARMGAVPAGKPLWVKHRTPPLNWAVGALLQTLEAPQVETHEVFKRAQGPASAPPSV
ncbi:MAG: GNAT family N-acetyltransferase [Myxococcaceae bacterium]